MKKLTKVIFIIALLAMVVLPLSARKAMNVSWEWLLSDPDVTAYRYQLNGEAEDGWTVVDGKTSAYTATGLDPYSDYTLYLQCSYDGINWSESASSTAYALLKLEEEAPAVEAAPVEAEETAEETVFYVYGFGISNRWTKSSFESVTLDDGLLTSDDVLGFIQYEAAKYPAFVNSVYYSLIDNGFSLTYEEGSVDVASLLPQYRADITEYIDSLLVSLAETVEETVAEAVETALDSLVEEAVAAMIVAAYPDEASLVTYSIDGDTVTLTYPETSDEFLLGALDVLRKEAMALIDRIEAAKPVSSAEAPVEVSPAAEVKAEEAPAAKSEEIPAPAESEKALEAPAPVAVEAAPVKETKKDSPKADAVRASFNMGLNGGLEWGMGKVMTEGMAKTPTIYPFVSLTLEGQNLVHFGAFGLGLRSDVSAVFIPESRNMSSNPTNVWGYDATADLKLMAYINASFGKFYLGAGAGYSAASDGFTSVHSKDQRILEGVGGGVGFNTAFALTGVLGVQFNLGKTVTLSAEGYARWFFDNPGKLDTLTVAATVGLGVRF